MNIGVFMENIKNQYQTNGFYIQRQALTAKDCDQMNGEIAEIANGKYSQTMFTRQESDAKREEIYRKILCLHEPHTVSSMFIDYIRHPNLTKVLTETIGPSVKCTQSMYFVKAPGLPGQAWHQDEAYIPTRDRSLCGVWIALDDATVENGCLWVVPKSHEKGYLYQMRDHNQPDRYDVSQQAYGFDTSTEIPVELKKGDALFFNGYLLHKSEKNKTKDNFRRAIVYHCMNAYSLLPWKTSTMNLEGVPMGLVDNRRVFHVIGEDPYAWKGYNINPKDLYLRKYDDTVIQPAMA